jgi:hypothetical protein
MTPAEYFTLAGLVLTFVGALRAALPAMISEDAAAEIGTARYASSDQAENIKQPLPSALAAQSRGAKHGMWLIAIGSALQVTGLLVQ